MGDAWGWLTVKNSDPMPNNIDFLDACLPFIHPLSLPSIPTPQKADSNALFLVHYLAIGPGNSPRM